MNKLDEERRNKNIEKENERFTIETHTFNEKYINKAGNISDEVCQTKYVELDGVAVTNDYMYLKQIDKDIFIFGNLIINPKDYGLACKEDFNGDIAAKKKYGILKLKRRLLVGELVIDNLKEEIIVPAVYDGIEPNKDKVVTVYGNNLKSYFDYERKVQLLPLMLEEAGEFGSIYEGFAECSTKDKSGYLPRDVIPVTKEQDIKLLDEKQVEILTKYQVEIDTIVETNQLYNDITGCSYTRRKK